MNRPNAPTCSYPYHPALGRGSAGRRSRVLATTAAVAAFLALPAACGAVELRSQSGPYQLEILVGGTPVPAYQHAGETWVLGQMGDRYTLRIWNRSGRRAEAVVSVDGRDVIDGKPADFRNKRGYLVPAWGFVDIEGWRISSREAAAFRFTTVANSYAGRTGNARDVGVIGVAVFPERPRPRPRPLYVPTPEYRYDGLGGESSRDRGGAGRGAESRPDMDDAQPSASAPPPAPAAGASSRGPDAEELSDATAKNGDGRHNRAPAPQRRPGLGTEFGEAVDSHVRQVAFVRAHETNPAAVFGVRYNDRDGLLAMGIDVDYLRSWSDADVRRSADPFPVADRRFAAPPPGWRR